jgi:hypothetical protein
MSTFGLNRNQTSYPNSPYSFNLDSRYSQPNRMPGGMSNMSQFVGNNSFGNNINPYVNNGGGINNNKPNFPFSPMINNNNVNPNNCNMVYSPQLEFVRNRLLNSVLTQHQVKPQVKQTYTSPQLDDNQHRINLEKVI